MSSTTIRVKTDTKDRLQEFALEHRPGASHDEVINHLLDEQWKITCIAQADHRRETDRVVARTDMAVVTSGEQMADELDEDRA